MPDPLPNPSKGPISVSTHSRYLRAQQPVVPLGRAAVAIVVFAVAFLCAFCAILYGLSLVSPAFALLNMALLAAFMVKKNLEVRTKQQ